MFCYQLNEKCRIKINPIYFCSLVVGLILLSNELAWGHAGAHRPSQDAVAGHKAVKDIKQSAEDNNPPKDISNEKHGTLKLTVLDKKTNNGIPFMVSITRKSDGLDFPPPNAVNLSILFEEQGDDESRRKARLPRTLGGYTWCVPGSFVANLPVGQWELVIRRGIEYYPIRETIHIAADKTVEKVMHTRRWENMAKRGWFAGDGHVHCRTENDTDVKMVMGWAKAEDLNVVNALLMGDIKKTYFATRGFGKENRIIDGNVAIVPGQEDPRTFDMGHVIGLNITDAVSHKDTYHCYDHAFDDFHAQGGLAGYAHTHTGWFVHRDMSLNVPKGKVDFFEIFQDGWLGTDRLYTWLNLGFRISALAGSDVPWFGTVGEERVYVYTGSDTLNVDDWFQAIREGHTFVTNGPMIEFSVDGAMPGDTINTTTNQLLHVRARAWATPEDFRPYRLEIIQHGHTIRSVEQVTPEQTELVLDFDIYSENGFWIAARVVDDSSIDSGKRAEAHTTPIYVKRNGLRFWKYNQVEKLLNARKADLDEVEKMIQLAHQTHDEGVNHLDFNWEYKYRADRIIATESLLMERVQSTRAIYDNLRITFKQESSLR